MYQTSLLKDLNNELKELALSNLSSDLDFNRLSIKELNNIISEKDIKSYNNVMDSINDLAVKAKSNDGTLSSIDQNELIRLYKLPEYIKGQDYKEAIAILDEYNDKIAETTKQMLLSSNSYEYSFKSIGATTEKMIELRKKQIEEEKKSLSDSLGGVDLIKEKITKTYSIFGHTFSLKLNKLEKLSDVTEDNFIQIYESIDPSNTDLIKAMENYGDLLVEQAQLNYEAIEAEKELIALKETVSQTLQDEYDILFGIKTAREIELEGLNDLEKVLQKQIYTQEDSIKAQEEAIALQEQYASAIESAGNSINTTINSIKGNVISKSDTSDLLREYNQTKEILKYRASQGMDVSNYVDDLTTMASSISNSSFGDTEALNKGLIAGLEQTKLDIGYEDEIMRVHIVASDLNTSTQTYTPSVVVANNSSNATVEERLATLEGLLTTIATTLTKDYKISLDFQQNGIKEKA
jgi:hypothetical protein